jgi:alkanesulfonate monooxygenase SsuD/methylene tetrahydromethanopterin reductase-like flavin-dependent oxidoreductase (luciferase family)
MPMTVGTGIPTDMTHVPEKARQAERLGYDSVSVGETAHNPFLPLVLVAEHTQRLHFGSSVAIAFPRCHTSRRTSRGTSRSIRAAGSSSAWARR